MRTYKFAGGVGGKYWSTPGSDEIDVSVARVGGFESVLRGTQDTSVCFVMYEDGPRVWTSGAVFSDVLVECLSPDSEAKSLSAYLDRIGLESSEC